MGAILALGFADNAWSLNFSVDDFSTQQSASPSDTQNLANGWGDSLYINIEGTRWTQTFEASWLNDGVGDNGVSAANPVISVDSGRGFQLAYVAWDYQHTFSNASVGQYTAPAADIVKRTLSFSPSTVVLSDATIIAGNENRPDTAGIFYNGANFVPAPSYLNFSAWENSYMAYWTTLKFSGSLRRTSDEDAQGKPAEDFGVYVLPGSPQILPYYGAVGMSSVPGSNSNIAVLAYDVGIGPGQGTIRWENLSSSSTDSVVFTSSTNANFMLDFAIAADTAGNSLAIWREDDILYGTAYALDKTLLMPITQIVPGSIYKENVPFHTYKQYAVADLSQNRFLVVYGIGGSIFLNTIDVSVPLLGTQTEITPGCASCYFPNIDISENYAAISWYGNTQGGTSRVEGAVFEINSGSLTVSSRLDVLFSTEEIAYNVGGGWQPWHNYRTPALGVNNNGDVAVGFDNGFGARLAGWNNAPYYYDSALFVSAAQPFRNDSLGLEFISGSDSGAIYYVDFEADSEASLALAIEQDSTFGGGNEMFSVISEFDSLSSPIFFDGGYFKYKITLPAIGPNKLLSATAGALNFSYNIKPKTPQIDSIQILPGGEVETYNPNTVYNPVIRRDSVRLIVSALDLDGDDSMVFSHFSDSNWQLNGSYIGAGFSGAEFIIPPKPGVSRQITSEFEVRDSRNWASERTGLSLDYQNSRPQLSVQIIKPVEFLGSVLDTSALSHGDMLNVYARDSQYVAVQFSDSNDVSLQIQLLEEGEIILDSNVASAGQAIWPLIQNTKAGPLNYQFLIFDAEDSASLSFTVNFQNPFPMAEVWSAYVNDYSTSSRDSAELSAGADPVFFARDSVSFYVSVSDTNDLSHQIEFQIGDSLLTSQNLMRGQTARISYVHPAAESNVSHLLSISDNDTTFSYSWGLGYANIPPSMEGMLSFHRGNLAGGKFISYGGDTVTTGFVKDSSYILNQGDSLTLQLTVSDPIDSLFTVSVNIGGNSLGQRFQQNAESARWNMLVPFGNENPVDLQIIVEDADTVLTQNISILPNPGPGWDSLSSFFGNEVIDEVGYSSMPSLNIAPGLNNTLLLKLSSRSSLFPGGNSVGWHFYQRGANCPVGQMQCYTLVDSAFGDSLEKVIPSNQDMVRLYLEDSYGFKLLDTIALKFPYLDTTSDVNAQYRGQVLKLLEDSVFVIGSSIVSRRNSVQIINTGSGALEIRSAKTTGNNQNWMSYSMSWVDPDLGSQNISVLAETHSNPLLNPARVFPDNNLSISFSFSAENLTGDGIARDTLLLTTNDFQNPVLRIPFSFHYVDLPTVEIFLRKIDLISSLKKSIGKKQTRPPRTRDEILIKFSEPVAWNSLDSQSVKIYSYYDSLKSDSIRSIPGYFPNYFNPFYSRNNNGGQIDSLVDSVVFSPRYLDVSDSFNVKPLNGQFIVGDRIHVNLSNSITDSVGNPLDVFLRKVLANPGTEDSTVTLSLEAQPLQILSVYPEPGSNNADPEWPIEIHFNQPLEYEYFHDSLGRSVVSVDTANILSDSNLSVYISSSENNHQPYQIKYLKLRNDDSTLLIKTQPNFFSRDSVFVTLFNNIGTGNGITLDGNSDGLGRFWYDPQTSIDHYRFSFVTKKVDFYIYPNPFRWSESSHREKGSMTFKNLTSLKGVKTGTRLSFRIYTMNGDLVYNSSERNEDFRFRADVLPTWDWNVKNTHQNEVGTGVYIYSIFKNSKDLIKKGKLAVIQ